ncbi:HIT domain-containing protein [Patellaria atrata CBS 101060]|uniref:Aprataxin-like protein n=1 Tax=Patellaria atrata CBS 101060 TaxID=1346257 RepID=A0A9P4S8H6_9PEZI|nr:HIT domain-containing protein [Patellaria atrata CBS 101060]
MSSLKGHPQDAINEEEIASTSLPLDSTLQESGSARKPVNAFTKLMSSQKANNEQSSPSETRPSRKLDFSRRDGLGAYTADPESFKGSRVVYHNENFVVINDLFPKSEVHLLLLPRDTSKQLLHPFEAFKDPDFLALVKAEMIVVREYAAKELKRRFRQNSRSEQVREAVLEKALLENLDLDPTDDSQVAALDLPPGRDWHASLISGVHASPSMNHLHVHVLSTDRHSECMKHRKHYNSFATPFLVPVEDLPLQEDDLRWHPGRAGYLDENMRCWRCRKDFGNKFKRLKEHLEEEFESWKSE